ncbi:Flagellar motor switch protein FliN [hydrothermal vent metagenome]|uniref:Flagellar motor switch protein FliN n=1 Tax=hydrothermal vent metagenome TaxID=652676 RepID=A0A3B0ZEZ1_9ZZZZ
MSDTDVENGQTDDVMDDWADALAEASESENEAQPESQPEAQPAALDSLVADGTMSIDEDVNLDVILDIPVIISMEVGSTRINIRNLLQLNQGSVIELDRMAGEPLDIKVNGTLIAHGEVVVVNEKFGIRLTDVISPAERVKKLK